MCTWARMRMSTCAQHGTSTCKIAIKQACKHTCTEGYKPAPTHTTKCASARKCKMLRAEHPRSLASLHATTVWHLQPVLARLRASRGLQGARQAHVPATHCDITSSTYCVVQCALRCKTRPSHRSVVEHYDKKSFLDSKNGSSTRLQHNVTSEVQQAAALSDPCVGARVIRWQRRL